METTTTTGTGTLSLAGAVAGFTTIVAAIGTGNTSRFRVEAVDADGVPTGEWEEFSGVITDATPDTLTRAAVLKSSNSNNAVNLSAGTKRVYIIEPGEHKPFVTLTGAADGDILQRVGGVWVNRTAAQVAASVGNDPIFDAFGAPDAGFEFDSSSLSGLTALSPTPDVEAAHTVVPGHYYVLDTTSGANAWSGRYVARAAPLTIIAKVSDIAVRDFGGACVFVGEATPGVMEVTRYSHNSGLSIRHTRFSDPSTYGGVDTLLLSHPTPAVYLAIRANSTTDVDHLYSLNGRVWYKGVDSRNPSITIGSCGIAIESNNSLGAAAIDFMRVWHSAKAFPGAVA